MSNPKLQQLLARAIVATKEGRLVWEEIDDDCYRARLQPGFILIEMIALVNRQVCLRLEIQDEVGKSVEDYETVFSESEPSEKYKATRFFSADDPLASPLGELLESVEGTAKRSNKVLDSIIQALG